MARRLVGGASDKWEGPGSSTGGAHQLRVGRCNEVQWRHLSSCSTSEAI